MNVRLRETYPPSWPIVANRWKHRVFLILSPLVRACLGSTRPWMFSPSVKTCPSAPPPPEVRLSAVQPVVFIRWMSCFSVAQSRSFSSKQTKWYRRDSRSIGRRTRILWLRAIIARARYWPTQGFDDPLSGERKPAVHRASERPQTKHNATPTNTPPLGPPPPFRCTDAWYWNFII